MVTEDRPRVSWTTFIWRPTVTAASPSILLTPSANAAEDAGRPLQDRGIDAGPQLRSPKALEPRTKAADPD